MVLNRFVLLCEVCFLTVIVVWFNGWLVYGRFAVGLIWVWLLYVVVCLCVVFVLV